MSRWGRVPWPNFEKAFPLAASQTVKLEQLQSRTTRSPLRLPSAAWYVARPWAPEKEEPTMWLQEYKGLGGAVVLVGCTIW